MHQGTYRLAKHDEGCYSHLRKVIFTKVLFLASRVNTILHTQLCTSRLSMDCAKPMNGKCTHACEHTILILIASNDSDGSQQPDPNMSNMRRGVTGVWVVQFIRLYTDL